ncbi:Hypothetical_protein [Hexamita inflata]|uniref:Hypothetical_protein n=1 Tax=Hexamita inflata TaxID=28002 RepID=A0AA86RG39_9EUKA|nr:Hypothetical protein HINF_LOCUS64986 [Hexamita inflata]
MNSIQEFQFQKLQQHIPFLTALYITHQFKCRTSQSDEAIHLTILEDDNQNCLSVERKTSRLYWSPFFSDHISFPFQINDLLENNHSNFHSNQIQLTALWEQCPKLSVLFAIFWDRFSIGNLYILLGDDFCYSCWAFQIPFESSCMAGVREVQLFQKYIRSIFFQKMMSQVKNYFWHAQTQYYSNSTKKDTEPQCTQMI